jgi:hypothetical protein
VAILAPPFYKGKHQQRNRSGQDASSRVIDHRTGGPLRLLQRQSHDNCGCDPEGDVDIEDPAPGPLIGDEASDDRPNDARQSPDSAEERLHTRTLLQRKNVTDDRHAKRHQSPRPQPLNRAEDDELRHRAGEAREDRADKEDGDA